MKETVEIADIRGTTILSNTEKDMREAIIAGISTFSVSFEDARAIRKGLSPPKVMLRSLPTMILYDDKGLEIFDRLTYNEDYYLTDAEIDILKRNSAAIVRDYVSDGAVLIELGAGAMRKTKYLLEAIQESKKEITYCAVDLARDSLIQSLTPLVAAFPSIKFVGLWGTYDDSLEWAKSNVPNTCRKIYFWLGSSIGNLTRKQAAEFMTSFRNEGMNNGDVFICGIDRRNDFNLVSLAYNDRAGISRAFSMNGLTHINNLFGVKLFDLEKFDYVSIYNEVEGRHEAYFSSKLDQTISHNSPAFSVELKKDEMISFEYSYKYSSEEVSSLIHTVNLSSLGKFTDSKNMYDLHVFYKSPVFFDRNIHRHSPNSVPSLLEWTQVWALTDLITTVIVNSSRCLSKPIDLRHPYIFYIGHLPAFLDMQLSKALNESPLGPDNFPVIFERGMDPIIETPNICHPHSKAPDQWPLLKDVLEYRDRVRKRALNTLTITQPANRLVRIMNMTYEHEAMHAETLLYMVLQDEPTYLSILPPPIFQQHVQKLLPEASWITMNGASIKLGLDSVEADDESGGTLTFGWDNESPSTIKNVSSFQIQHRPVSVSEYHAFLILRCWEEDLIPVSWIKIESEWKVRTLYGLVSINIAFDWPASVSHYQAKEYAISKGCSLPTEEELVYARSAVPSKLSDNHSFSNLNPVPVIYEASVFTDAVGNGWEHTSTLFAPFSGFVKSELYPGYSSDFFDGKHYVVLGGSWATVPRIALRHSFRNWYQSKYGYPFSKFRMVQRP